MIFIIHTIYKCSISYIYHIFITYKLNIYLITIYSIIYNSYYIYIGSIYTNDQIINLKSYRKESGYVMQSDALFPLFTVKETLQYAAYLRINHKTKQEKDTIVDVMIDLLKLSKVFYIIIGI